MRSDHHHRSGALQSQQAGSANRVAAVGVLVLAGGKRAQLGLAAAIAFHVALLLVMPHARAA